MKTAIAVISALAVFAAAIPASALSVSSVAFEKGSRSEYIENSYLNVREEVLWSFDEIDEGNNYTVDSKDAT